LLGASINIAVAWGCIFSVPDNGAGATQRLMEPPSDFERQWIVSHGHQPAEGKRVAQVRWFGVDARQYLLQRPKWARTIEEAGISVGLPFEPCVRRVVAGFPTMALNEELWRYYNDTEARARPQHETVWGLDGPWRGMSSYFRDVLPLRAMQSL